MTAGILGRSFLANLCGIEPFSNDLGNSRAELERLQGEDTSLLPLLGEFIRDFAHGQNEMWRQAGAIVSEADFVIEEAADLLFSGSEYEWWGSHMAREEQRVLAETYDMRNMTDPLSQEEPVGAWWSTVHSPSIARSTRGPVDGKSCVAAICPEDAFIARRSETKKLHPAEGARVAEIESLQDWVELTSTYPRHLPESAGLGRQPLIGIFAPWVMPDWTRVADQFDAVHISVCAYLAAAYEPVKIGRCLTILSGWNPDETLWLNDSYHVDPETS